VKRFLILTTVFVGALLFAVAALAQPGANGNSSRSKHAKFTYVVNTTDNGSCGTAWADDTVTRTFVV
jgi:uncharacterized low-complexity protein